MACERDASSVGMYRLNVDGRDLGKFKSSGILMSTGTGSTGWLYSAKSISPHKISHLKKLIGLKPAHDNNIDLIDYAISKRLSNATHFQVDKPELYYFVREGFQETAISEGHCSELIFTSEMLSGEVKIDGHSVIPVNIGDRFKVTVDPQYTLKCMKFLM